MVSEPGPSVSSQTVVDGDPVGAAAAAVLDDPVRLLELDDRRVHPDRAQRRRRRGSGRRRRPRSDSIRVRWKSERKWSVKDGRGGEVGDRLEDPLARDVDLDLGADRAHRGAILVRRQAGRSDQMRRNCSDAATRARYDRSQRRREGGQPSSPVSAPARLDDSFETGSDPRRGHVLLPRLRLPALAARERRAARLPALRRLRASAATRSSSSMQEHGGTTAEFAAPPSRAAADWLRRGAASCCPAPAATSPAATTTARSQVFAIERGLDPDRPQRHRRHPPRRPQRLPPPRPDRLRSPTSRCACSTTAASTASSSTASTVEWGGSATATSWRSAATGSSPLEA